MLVILIAAGLLGQHFFQMLGTLTRLSGQLALQRAFRYSTSMLSTSLSEETSSVSVSSKNGTNGSVLKCSLLSANKSFEFYVQKKTLYRRTITEVYNSKPKSGINPISLPGIEVSNFIVTRLSPQLVELSFTLLHTESGSSAKFTKEFYLCNGTVTES